MSPRAWNVLRAIVLASPFIVFVFLLITSPPGAGTFAGSLLGKITDPPVLLGIILSGAVGALGYRWPWALGVGAVVSVVGCVMGYSWWEKVAGSAVANRTAAFFAIWAIFLAAYGFIAGRMFYRPKAVASNIGN